MVASNWFQSTVRKLTAGWAVAGAVVAEGTGDATIAGVGVETGASVAGIEVAAEDIASIVDTCAGVAATCAACVL